MHEISTANITGLILAGGRATRMENVDKGLQMLRGKPLIQHVSERLAPQVGAILINANRHLDIYSQYGQKVISDLSDDFAGPLAGMQAGLHACQTDYLLTVPCDSPFLPTDLSHRLSSALIRQNADITVATTIETFDGKEGECVQAVFCLMHTRVLPSLDTFLRNEKRKVRDWFGLLQMAKVSFQDANDFRNINTFEELHSITS